MTAAPSKTLTISDLAAVAKTLSANANEASSKHHSTTKEYREARRNVCAADLLISALEAADDAILVGKETRAEAWMALVSRHIADALAQAERDGIRRAGNAISALEA